MQGLLQRLWPYATNTLISLLAASALTAAIVYVRGGRDVCAFSNGFFWGGVLVILAGGLVAGLSNRSSTEQPKSERSSLRELEKEKEKARQERHHEREQAMNMGIAVALAAIPMLIIAWRLCPFGP